MKYIFYLTVFLTLTLHIYSQNSYLLNTIESNIQILDSDKTKQSNDIKLAISISPVLVFLNNSNNVNLTLRSLFYDSFSIEAGIATNSFYKYGFSIHIYDFPISFVKFVRFGDNKNDSYGGLWIGFLPIKNPSKIFDLFFRLGLLGYNSGNENGITGGLEFGIKYNVN